METQDYDVGMVGLGIMGRNVLLNMLDRGYSAVGLDTDAAKVKAFVDEAKGQSADATTDPMAFVTMLRKPRVIMLLLPAGAPVDAVIRELVPLLSSGDLLVDAGNSHFTETDQRYKALAGKSIHFFGMGVSGGESGARHGPSMMPGGPKDAYERVRPILEAIAAKVGGEPCVAYLGPGSAGHYVKMVHNGIEYALMQLISETYDLMKRGMGLSNEEQVDLNAVRGQYDSGSVRGNQVLAYRAEKRVSPESNVETFAAVRLQIDNWRWHGVPFYLRSGKRMPARVSEVVIQFRPVPHLAFPPDTVPDIQPNRIVLRIQPDEGIDVKIQAKQPGSPMRLQSVAMDFLYKEAFRIPEPEAYETLLLDVILGDATQFMRADHVEAAWTALMPILTAWEDDPPTDFPNYAAGSWGPDSAVMLLARDGRKWWVPELHDIEGGKRTT